MSEQATVGQNQVVSIDYVLTDENGEEMDSSEEGHPLQYLHGHDAIVPGLEKALEGAKIGDKVKITVPPEEGYGERDPERVFDVPRDRFDFDVEPGQVVKVQTPKGESPPLMIIAVTEDSVTLDGNHPLAGKTLTFDVTVAAIRPATKEELDHGHVH